MNKPSLACVFDMILVGNRCRTQHTHSKMIMVLKMDILIIL
ncbi:hypothetical protein GYH30_039161 [Glycine max]|uniref:Uncharacterized protein n=1 Tax=Glycine max TaxID=3847 RepID=A0A0R0GJU6_SOYBN|nr:hypothetical protein GYH30_039161 [Glycine max]